MMLSQFLLKEHPKALTLLAKITRAILGIGSDGGDNLMMSFLNLGDMYSIS